MNKILHAVVLTVATSALLWGCGKDETVVKPVSFAAEVAPILKANCLECHTPEGKGYEASGLLMVDAANPAEVSYEALMKGTKFGPIIVPGDSTSSALNMLVEGRADPSIKMPHGKDALTPEQLAALKQWVEQGAQKN
ncbi:MAG: c-type cytochrome [Thiotrichales bacterium]